MSMDTGLKVEFTIFVLLVYSKEERQYANGLKVFYVYIKKQPEISFFLSR